MTKETLPQQDELCRKLVQQVVESAADALTIKEICNRVHAREGVTLRLLPAALIRKTIVALEDEEVLDSDQPPTRDRVFFLAGRRPRTGVRWVQAADVPRIAPIAPRPWFSALGAVA